MIRKDASIESGTRLGPWIAWIAIGATFGMFSPNTEACVGMATVVHEDVNRRDPQPPAVDPWSPVASPAPLALGRRHPGADKPYWRRNLFKRVLVDQKYFVTQWLPSEVRDPAFSVPLGASLLVAGSSRRGARALDDRAELFVGKWIRGKAEQPATLISDLGDADTAVILVGSAYLFARLTHHDRLAETTSLAAEALIDTAIWSTALKRLSSRARPGDAPSSRILNRDIADGKSFPSGHAMGAFAVAAVVSGQHPGKKWVPWVAYGTASLVAGSRVALGRHYVSDVVAGAVLGRSIGRMVVARAGGKVGAPVHSWTPIVDPSNRGYGVAYTHSW